MDKKEIAVNYKHNGCNCCQAVLAAYSDELDLTLDDAKKLGSAFGLGMGNMMGNCGALCGAQMVLGMREYGSSPVGAKARALLTDFTDKCGANICADIKGILTGKVLCSCDDCVRNAVDALEKVSG